MRERLDNLVWGEGTGERRNAQCQVRDPRHRIAAEVGFILTKGGFKNIRGTQERIQFTSS